VAVPAAIEDGVLEWVGSEYLDFEIGQDPDRERVRRVTGLLSLVGRRIEMSDPVVERARALERFGLRDLDALHIASVEAGWRSSPRSAERTLREGSPRTTCPTIIIDCVTWQERVGGRK
jgi:hypothetical protein